MRADPLEDDRSGYEVADPLGTDPANPPPPATLFRDGTVDPDETSTADFREADRRARDAVRRHGVDEGAAERRRAWDEGSEPWALPLPHGGEPGPDRSA